MSDTANILYGSDDTQSQASTPNPALAQTATARQFYDHPATGSEQRGTGDARVLFDAPGAIDEAARSIVDDAVDRGRIMPGDAETVAAQLTTELESLGIAEQSIRNGLMRDLRRPALQGVEAEKARGATLRELHSRHGNKAQQLLAETNAWLRRTAPTIGAALGLSAAGNDVRYVVDLVDSYVRSTRRK